MDDNWEQARRQITVGSIVSGEVEATRPFGVFVRLDLGPLALLLFPYFEPAPRDDEDFPKPGDRLTAVVRIIDDNKRQIGLTQKMPVETAAPGGMHC